MEFAGLYPFLHLVWVLMAACEGSVRYQVDSLWIMKESRPLGLLDSSIHQEKSCSMDDSPPDAIYPHPRWQLIELAASGL